VKQVYSGKMLYACTVIISIAQDLPGNELKFYFA